MRGEIERRHPHQQLLPSDDLELVTGLAVFPLVIVSQGGSLLYKGIRNPNSIRVRARAAASFSQVSTKGGASSPRDPFVDNFRSAYHP